MSRVGVVYQSPDVAIVLAVIRLLWRSDRAYLRAIRFKSHIEPIRFSFIIFQPVAAFILVELFFP